MYVHYYTPLEQLEVIENVYSVPNVIENYTNQKLKY